MAGHGTGRGPAPGAAAPGPPAAAGIAARRRRDRRWKGRRRRGRRETLIAAAVAAGIVLVLAAIVLGTRSSLSPPAPHLPATRGVDVSWPQCHGTVAAGMPAATPSYLIIGVTDGSGGTVNPCLESQVAWARSRVTAVGAYLVPTLPTAREARQIGRGCGGGRAGRMCRMRRAGAAQAASGLGVIRAAHLSPPIVWLDVETRVRDPWRAHDLAINRAVVAGAMRRLRGAGVKVGIYTTATQWAAITGDYRLAVPNWVPVGSDGPAAAVAHCGSSATGGPVWLVQWTATLDQNRMCDAVPGHTKLRRVRQIAGAPG